MKPSRFTYVEYLAPFNSHSCYEEYDDVAWGLQWHGFDGSDCSWLIPTWENFEGAC